MRNLIQPFTGACVLALLAACNASSPLDAASKAAAPPPAPPLAFEPAVKVLPANGFGYEPTIISDEFGNLWHTSHKENYELALAPDANSPTQTRSMSWARISYDNGKTWTEPPGLTLLSLQNHQVGDEGDMALDDAHHLYFVDTYVTDVTLTRWTVNGPGKVTFDFSNPALPALQPSDDRPWITAHGDGHVFYLGNEGNKNTYTLGQGTGSGFGPGRFSLYASYDGGKTFDPRGYTLNDSGWCRPAADHAPGSLYVYVFCGNDAGLLFSYVSADDGHVFERYDVSDFNSLDGNVSNPSNPQLQVAADGKLYAVFIDGGENAGESRVRLFSSKDHGVTWTEQDITPFTGRFVYAWLSVSPDGKKLGMAIYGKPAGQAWFVYAGVWTPGKVPVMVSVDPANPTDNAAATSSGGDYLGSYFSPDGYLNVVWQRANALPQSRDIYFSRTTKPAKSLETEPSSHSNPMPAGPAPASCAQPQALVNTGIKCNEVPVAPVHAS